MKLARQCFLPTRPGITAARHTYHTASERGPCLCAAITVSFLETPDPYSRGPILSDAINQANLR